jgi:nucleoid DNA-binding protein
MARPKRDESKFLDEKNLCKAIKSNQALKGRDLTLDDIRSVLEAYSDIIYTCLKYDINVTLPQLGFFSKTIKKGFKGGWIKTCDVSFQKGSSTSAKYFEPKPDYGKITLNIRKGIAEKFRQETTMWGTENQ